MCTDLSKERVVVLPYDVAVFQNFTKPKDLDVATAVRIAVYIH